MFKPPKMRWTMRIDRSIGCRSASLLCGVFCASLVLFRSEVCGEDVGKDVQKIRDIARMHRENREKIERWQGDVDIVTVLTCGDFKLTRTAEARFVFDRQRNAMQYVYRITKWEQTESEIYPPQARTGQWSGCLWIDDQMYDLRMADHTAVDQQGVVIYPRKEPKISLSAYQFCPFDVLSVRTTDPDSFFRTLDRLFLGRGKSFEGYVEDLGNGITRVRKRSSHKYPDMWWEGDFSTKHGGNLVRSHQTPTEGEITGNFNAKYVLLGGAYVPEECEYESLANGVDTALVPHVKIKFRRQTVNADLPVDAFTLEFMGVTAGARLVDYETKSSSTYQPHGSVKPEKSLSPTSSKKAGVIEDAMPVISAISSDADDNSNGITLATLLSGTGIVAILGFIFLMFKKASQK